MNVLKTVTTTAFCLTLMGAVFSPGAKADDWNRYAPFPANGRNTSAASRASACSVAAAVRNDEVHHQVRKEHAGENVVAGTMGQWSTVAKKLRHHGPSQLQTVHSFTYAILRRLNTGTLAKSTMNAKTAAATSVPPTTNTGRGLMAIPQVASVEAISRSTTDDPTSHRLGREDPMRRRSRFV